MPPDDFDPAQECVEIVEVETAVADLRTCARASTGRVRCWGEQLDGEIIGDDEPAWMAEWLNLELDSVSVGLDVCGRAQGRLGCLEPFSKYEGDPVIDGFDFGRPVASVAVGHSGACAVLDDGTLRCWGNRSIVGVETNEPLGDDDEPSTVVLPGAVIGVALGFDSACAVLDDGQVACWGSDPQCELDEPCGILGVPGSLESSTPKLIEMPTAALEVSVGTLAACARLEGGSFTCWGDERLVGRGAGGGNIGDDETPASLPPLALDQGVEQVDVGTGAACLLAADGSVRCWGGAPVATPLDPWGEDVLDPLVVDPIPLPEPAVTISVGYGSACALGESGSVYCWSGGLGYGGEDVIGLDPSITQVQPVPVLDPRCDEP
ncbi:RCC1 domain-containing protein [Nannocystaceae bacterium ST9]